MGMQKARESPAIQKNRAILIFWLLDRKIHSGEGLAWAHAFV